MVFVKMENMIFVLETVKTHVAMGNVAREKIMKIANGIVVIAEMEYVEIRKTQEIVFLTVSMRVEIAFVKDMKQLRTALLTAWALSPNS
jgi:hypothetical protein